MGKIKDKISFLTALNSIFLKSDDIINGEENQINSINSSSELSDEEKSLLIKSLNSSIKDLEKELNNLETKKIAPTVKVNSIKAVAEVNEKIKNAKNGNNKEEKEKN